MNDKYDLNKIGKIKNSIKGVLDIPEDSSQSHKNLKEKEFYQEIDKKSKKNSCSIFSIIVLLLIIFVLLVLLLFYIKNYTKSGIDYIVENKNISQSDIKDDFVSKTQNMQTGETILLEYSEVQVANYIGLADADFPLKRSRLEIDERGIIITGKTSDRLISLPISVVVRPKVDLGKFILILDEVASGSITLPKIVKNNINDYLSRLMKTRELYDQNLEVISAHTTSDKLFIEVFKKIQ